MNKVCHKDTVHLPPHLILLRKTQETVKVYPMKCCHWRGRRGMTCHSLYFLLFHALPNHSLLEVSFLLRYQIELGLHYSKSPDYPTFRFIRRAVSERSILSTVIVRDWNLSRPHLFTLKNKGRRPLQTCYCSGAGVTLPQRRGRRFRSKYPLLIS
jgi:hypothetical protein